jgi:hypothetical protein
MNIKFKPICIEIEKKGCYDYYYFDIEDSLKNNEINNNIIFNSRNNHKHYQELKKLLNY